MTLRLKIQINLRTHCLKISKKIRTASLRGFYF